MLSRGYRLTAPMAAALGRTAELAASAQAGIGGRRQDAFGLAVINKQLEAARFASMPARTSTPAAGAQAFDGVTSGRDPQRPVMLRLSWNAAPS